VLKKRWTEAAQDMIRNCTMFPFVPSLFLLGTSG